MYSKVIQLYIYMYLISCKFFFHLGCYIILSMDRGAWQATVHGVTRVGHDLATKERERENVEQFPVLYCASLLVIHFKYSSMYMSTALLEDKCFIIIYFLGLPWWLTW